MTPIHAQHYVIMITLSLWRAYVVVVGVVVAGAAVVVSWPPGLPPTIIIIGAAGLLGSLGWQQLCWQSGLHDFLGAIVVVLHRFFEVVLVALHDFCLHWLHDCLLSHVCLQSQSDLDDFLLRFFGAFVVLFDFWFWRRFSLRLKSPPLKRPPFENWNLIDLKEQSDTISKEMPVKWLLTRS